MGINKRDIHELLGNLPFSCDSYWVLMGAAMVLHGIKNETNDIFKVFYPKALEKILELMN